MNKELQNIFKKYGIENLILAGYMGSISHGTFIPSNNADCIDDKDIMGIMLQPPEYYIGMKTREQIEIKEGDVMMPQP